MSDTPQLNRRDVMRVGLLAAAGASALAIPAIAQDPREPPSENPWRLVLDIPGAPEASKTALGAEIDPLEVTVLAQGDRKNGSPEDEFRPPPGAARWGQVSLTGAFTEGAAREVQAWFRDTAKGKNIRKNITITLVESDKEAGRRTFNLVDSFPMAYSFVGLAAEGSAGVRLMWRLEVRVDRIEMA